MTSNKKQTYVGMFRPRWEDIKRSGGYMVCPCGNILQTIQVIMEHWQLGHFDEPVYKKT